MQISQLGKKTPTTNELFLSQSLKCFIDKHKNARAK